MRTIIICTCNTNDNHYHFFHEKTNLYEFGAHPIQRQRVDQ